MKIVLSESQYRRLIETKEEGKIIKFPSLEFFDNNQLRAWHILQRILKTKGNPPYSIDGVLDLNEIDIKRLGNLESLNNLVSIGLLNLDGLPIKELNSLVRVEQSLFLENTPIKSLENLTSVGGDLDLKGSAIESLPKLKYVGATLGLRDTKIQNLDSLLRANNIFVANTPIKTLGNIKVLPGTLNFSKSEIENLRGLKEVGFNLLARSSAIESLGNLESVGRDLDLGETKIDSLGKLRYVGGDLNLYDTPLSDRMTREEIRNIVAVKGDIYM